MFASIIFFEIICSSFLREEVSRRVVFILYFRILWCPTMKSLFRLPVPLQVLVPVPLLAHRSKASSAGKHRAQTHIFSENEKGDKDKDRVKESSQLLRKLPYTSLNFSFVCPFMNHSVTKVGIVRHTAVCIL